MKRVLLKYFSGTGNSRRILGVCGDYFANHNCEVRMSSIADRRHDNFNEVDLIGFCFPVYAFSLPRLCNQFLKSLPPSDAAPKVFLLVTAGAADESGYALMHGKKRLAKKGYDVVYTNVVEMPSNWITFDSPPSAESAKPTLADGEKKARNIAANITHDRSFHHKFNVPKRMGHFRLFFEYVSFHYFGVSHMWRMFRVNSSCNGCGSCVKFCPTNSISLKDGTPKWHSSCEQCMRCANFCTKKAIFQTNGGATEGKNQYREPHFRPRKEADLAGIFATADINQGSST